MAPIILPALPGGGFNLPADDGLMNDMNELELTGRAFTHIVHVDVGNVPDARPCRLHRETVQSFLEMRAAAAADGLDLTVVSGFRDFEAQVRIWNAKFRGDRILYSREGHALDHASLTPAQAVEAILHWSALPGASRHHWGSEIDVIDRAALPAGHAARLLPAEYEADGPFAALTVWLERNMARFGFFKPYRIDHGGVSPEPWHLSHAPVSIPALAQLTEDALRRAVMESDMEGKDLALERLPVIYGQYVLNVDAP